MDQICPQPHPRASLISAVSAHLFLPKMPPRKWLWIVFVPKLREGMDPAARGSAEAHGSDYREQSLHHLPSQHRVWASTACPCPHPYPVPSPILVPIFILIPVPIPSPIHIPTPIPMPIHIPNLVPSPIFLFILYCPSSSISPSPSLSPSLSLSLHPSPSQCPSLSPSPSLSLPIPISLP